MPDLSGIRLAERIREHRPHLPVLLMSGYPAGSSPSHPDIPADLPLLRKPFDARTLLQHLHDALQPGPDATAAAPS
jgi:DNA-binding NtrC family response regulator